MTRQPRTTPLPMKRHLHRTSKLPLSSGALEGGMRRQHPIDLPPRSSPVHPINLPPRLSLHPINLQPRSSLRCYPRQTRIVHLPRVQWSSPHRRSVRYRTPLMSPPVSRRLRQGRSAQEPFLWLRRSSQSRASASASKFFCDVPRSHTYSGVTLLKGGRNGASRRAIFETNSVSWRRHAL